MESTYDISRIPFGFVLGTFSDTPSGDWFEGQWIVPDPKIPWPGLGTVAIYPRNRHAGDQYYLEAHGKWFGTQDLEHDLNLRLVDPDRIPWIRLTCQRSEPAPTLSWTGDPSTIRLGDGTDLAVPAPETYQIGDPSTVDMSRRKTTVTPMPERDPNRKMPRVVVEERPFSDAVVADLVERARACRTMNAYDSSQHILNTIFEHYPEAMLGSFNSRAEATQFEAEWNVAILDDRSTEQVLMLKREHGVRVEVPLTRQYESTWTRVVTDRGMLAARAHVVERLRTIADVLENDKNMKVQEFNLVDDRYEIPLVIQPDLRLHLVLEYKL